MKSGIDELLKADPKKGKFIQAIIRWYVSNEFKLEDVHRLNEDLTFFNRVKNKIENKDLLTYDTLKSVYDAIRPFQENENDSKSNKELMREAKAGAKKLYQEPGMIILELKLKKLQNYMAKELVGVLLLITIICLSTIMIKVLYMLLFFLIQMAQ